MFPANCSSRRAARSSRSFLATAVALAMLLSLCGTGSNAWAAPPGPDALPVSIVASKSDDALDQAEALTQALRKAVRSAQGWSLGESNQSLEFLAVKLKCSEPIDAACEAQIADVINADRYIYSVIKFSDQSEKMVVGSLGFFVRGQGTKRTSLSYSANLTDPNEDALVKVATDAFMEVTGGAPKGAVKLTTGGIAGQLFIDGKPQGAIPAEGGNYPLTAGQHRIVVKSPGYADAETTVNVRPLLTADTSVTMVKIEEGGPGVDGKLIGGIAALVVGAAATGVGIWGMLQVDAVDGDTAFQQFRVDNPGVDNVCKLEGIPTGIDDSCSKASAGELTQVIAFPIAAVAGGVGAFLLGTSSLAGGDNNSASAFRVTPVITPQLQAVSVSYSF